MNGQVLHRNLLVLPRDHLSLETADNKKIVVEDSTSYQTKKLNHVLRYHGEMEMVKWKRQILTKKNGRGSIDW